MLQIEHDPEDIAEAVGDKLGFMTRRIEGDLERFKQFIESRGRETGAWRGEVRQGRWRASRRTLSRGSALRMPATGD